MTREPGHFYFNGCDVPEFFKYQIWLGALSKSLI